MVAEAVPPAWRLTLVGLNETVGPVGETVAARFTVPEKVVPAVRVSVAVALEPW